MMLFNKIRLTCALCWMLIGALPAFAQTPKTEEMRDLTANHKLELTIGGGEAHHFQIRLNGGQFVRVIADQRSVDVVLSLFAPDGKLIYERDRPNGKEGEESLSAEVTTGGIYRLEVRALKKDAPVGKYELRSEVPRSPTQNDKRRISAEQALHEAEKLIAAPTIQSLREASAKYTQAADAWRELGDSYAETLTLENLAFAQKTLGEKLIDENTTESRRSAAAAYQTASEVFRRIGNRQRQAESIIDWGLAVEKLDGKDATLKIYDQALSLFRDLKNEKWEALTLNNIGYVYSLSGEKQKALEYYNHSVSLSRKAGDKPQEASTLANISSVHKDIGEKAEALKYMLESLALRKTIGNRPLEAGALVSVGLRYDDLGDKQKAIEYFNLALAIRREAGNKRAESMILRNIALVYEDLKDKRKALEYYDQILPLSRDLGDKNQEAATLRSIGSARYDLNEYREALSSYNKALKLFRELGDRQQEADLLNVIGVVHSALGEGREALNHYRQALPLYRSIGSKTDEARVLRNIGSAHNALGEMPEALKHFNLALALYEGAGHKEGEANTLNSIGIFYSGLQENRKALLYLNRSLILRRDAKDRDGEADALHSLGIVNDALGEYTEALRVLNLSLSIRRADKNRAGEAATLVGLGKTYLGLGATQKSLDHFLQALEIFREVGDKESEAITINGVGVVYFNLGDRQKALEYLNLALPLLRTIGNKKREAETSGNLMHALNAEKKPLPAIFYGKQAVNLFQEIRSNIRELDKELQLTYLKSIEPRYRKLADILISEGRILEAQAVLDLLKEQEYGQIVLRRNGERPDTVPYSRAESDIIVKIETVATLQREQGNLQKEQKEKGRLTDDKQKRLDRLLSDIEAANQAFREALNALGKSEASVESRVAEIESERNLQRILGRLGRDLDTGVVALYTVVGTGEGLEISSSGTSSNRQDGGGSQTKLKFGWVILVTPEGRKAYPIDVTELEETVFAFRAALSSDQYDPEPLARRIYDKLFRQTSDRQKQTLEADLQIYLGKYKHKTLMWSLDGVLRYIPTAALHDGTEFLVEKFRNVTFTKKSFLTLTEKDAAQWTALGLGVSEAKRVENVNFNALPEVERELHDVVRQTKESTGILSGTRRLNHDFTRDATIRLWREGKYPVIHIASHYSFNPADQTASFLLVGDGKLTFGDIQAKDNLFGTVDLLTLSACDTAMSANGKESEGFAFMAQDLGAKTVIASLWKVSDAGTPELMIRFYKARAANPQMAKGEAFRQAQLSLLYGEGKAKAPVKTHLPPRMGVIDLVSKRFEVPLYEKIGKPQFAHPHYWSSFIMIGNWR